MEQSSTFYQSSSMAHNYRANKGLNFKKAVLVALLVAFGLWFLYQIKNSDIKQKNYYNGTKTENDDISQESEVNLLIGRKGKVGLVVGSALEENGRRELDGGVGDDEFDGEIEEEEQMKTNGKVSVSQVREEAKQDEMLKGVHSFHDHTGVLLDGLYREQ